MAPHIRSSGEKKSRHESIGVAFLSLGPTGLWENPFTRTTPTWSERRFAMTHFIVLLLQVLVVLVHLETFTL